MTMMNTLCMLTIRFLMILMMIIKEMNRMTDIYLGSTHSYILKDNLGSWTTIIDDEGNVEQGMEMKTDR